LPDVKIPVDHPDATNPLLRAAARALTRRGATVVIDAAGDNLVRRQDGDAGVVVCAQGLPNLLHELVHVVLAGVLDDDHGIDYGAIPFDLATREGRQVLWEELSCCVLSCAYVARRQPGETAAAAEARVDAWFREQVDIQPVFYGMEDDPAAFWVRVDRCRRAYAPEVDATLGRAYRDVKEALREGGAAGDLAVPPEVLSLETLWSRTAGAA
jgi:hypothetical protein